MGRPDIVQSAGSDSRSARSGRQDGEEDCRPDGHRQACHQEAACCPQEEARDSGHRVEEAGDLQEEAGVAVWSV